MDVLIIERDVMLAAVLADSLAEDGVATVILRDDKEALALPQRSVPRVVITGICEAWLLEGPCVRAFPSLR